MSENCTHDCSSCSSNCSSRTKESFLKSPHAEASIKKAIAVVSGKGGVGKSLTTSLLGGETGINTVLTPSGMQMMSMNLLLDSETTPVLWRGAIISGTVLQFWTDVIWKDVDLLFIDMPPGTGAVPLTVFQSIPLAGVVIVTTPQDLVKMVVEKAVNMANMMNVPVLGLVENMSYLNCPDCGRRIEIFGQSKAAAIAEEYGIRAVSRMPLDARIAEYADAGRIEDYETDALKAVYEAIEKA